MDERKSKYLIMSWMENVRCEFLTVRGKNRNLINLKSLTNPQAYKNSNKNSYIIYVILPLPEHVPYM